MKNIKVRTKLTIIVALVLVLVASELYIYSEYEPVKKQGT